LPTFFGKKYGPQIKNLPLTGPQISLCSLAYHVPKVNIYASIIVFLRKAFREFVIACYLDIIFILCF
jgi:hypothetical protein